jgi:hypothetical protein
MKRVMGIVLFLFLFYSLCTSQPLDIIASGGDSMGFNSQSLAETNNASLYNPFLAGVLAIIPGAGHFYINEPLTGLAFLGGIGLVFGLTYIAALNPNLDVAQYGFLLWIGLYLANIVSAVRLAKAKHLNMGYSFQILPKCEIYHRAFSNSYPGFTLRLNL